MSQHSKLINAADIKWSATTKLRCMYRDQWQLDTDYDVLTALRLFTFDRRLDRTNAESSARPKLSDSFLVEVSGDFPSLSELAEVVFAEVEKHGGPEKLSVPRAPGQPMHRALVLDFARDHTYTVEVTR